MVVVDESLAYQRMLARERAAREVAESLLEQKSRELYEVNQKLRLSSAILSTRGLLPSDDFRCCPRRDHDADEQRDH